jgi:hypothetical protein
LRRAFALGAAALFAIACKGNPVGEAPSGGGGGGAGGSVGGSAGASGGAGGSVGGSAGASGSAGAGGSAGCSGICPPEILVPAISDGADGIALDATNVYYGSGLAVFAVDKTGGNPKQLTSVQTAVHEVAVDASTVFFTAGAHTLYSVSKSGGSAQILDASGGTEQYNDIATDGVHVYYTVTKDMSSYDGDLRRVPVGGGASEVVSSVSGSDPKGIALDGTDAYFANSLGGKILKAPKDGSQWTQVVSGPIRPQSIAVGQSLIYYCDSQASAGYGAKAGGTSTIVAGGSPGRDVVLDPSFVYWTSPSSGTVSRSGLGSGTSVPLVTSYGEPWSIAVDASGVYFTLSGVSTFGAVVRIAK